MEYEGSPPPDQDVEEEEITYLVNVPDSDDGEENSHSPTASSNLYERRRALNSPVGERLRKQILGTTGVGIRDTYDDELLAMWGT